MKLYFNFFDFLNILYIMSYINWIFGIAIAYTVLYPLVIYTVYSPNAVEKSVPVLGEIFSSGMENVHIGEKVEVSVTRKYLFLTLPKYIGSVCIDLFNKLWMVSFFGSIFFITYKIL